jgi:hypothetical protein
MVRSRPYVKFIKDNHLGENFHENVIFPAVAYEMLLQCKKIIPDDRNVLKNVSTDKIKDAKVLIGKMGNMNHIGGKDPWTMDQLLKWCVQEEGQKVLYPFSSNR